MSSAKRRLSSSLPLSFTPVPLPSFSASLITISSIRLNRSGDSPHPCITPTLILKHSINSYRAHGLAVHVLCQCHQFLRYSAVSHHSPQPFVPHTVKRLFVIYKVVV